MVIATGASLVGGAISSRAGQRGADAQVGASRYATDESARQYDQTRSDLQPWMEGGGWALGQQRDFLEGDYGAALKSPFYAASLEEGFKGLDAGAAANGNLWGGGMDADRMRLGQNLASSQLQTHYNALAGMSQTGQATANQLGAFGQQHAMNAGNNAMTGAGAQASAYANTANSWNNALGQGVGAYMYYHPPGKG